MDIIHLIFTLAPIIADSTESNVGAAAPLILLLSGFIFYGIMYARYRNADKRHAHEKETKTQVANPMSMDTYIQSRKGLSNASIQRANHTRVEGALNKSSSASKLIRG